MYRAKSCAEQLQQRGNHPSRTHAGSVQLSSEKDSRVLPVGRHLEQFHYAVNDGAPSSCFQRAAVPCRYESRQRTCGRRKTQGLLTLTEPLALTPPAQPTPVSSQLRLGSPQQPCEIHRPQPVSRLEWILGRTRAGSRELPSSNF